MAGGNDLFVFFTSELEYTFCMLFEKTYHFKGENIQ